MYFGLVAKFVVIIDYDIASIDYIKLSNLTFSRSIFLFYFQAKTL